MTPVSQQALPDDLSLSVLSIFSGGCFQVVLTSFSLSRISQHDVHFRGVYFFSVVVGVCNARSLATVCSTYVLNACACEN